MGPTANFISKNIVLILGLPIVGVGCVAAYKITLDGLHLKRLKDDMEKDKKSKHHEVFFTNLILPLNVTTSIMPCLG